MSRFYREDAGSTPAGGANYFEVTMALTPQEQQLLSKYDAASKKLGPSGPTGEKEFRDAYQALVKAGLAMQIRKKYRGS